MKILRPVLVASTLALAGIAGGARAENAPRNDDAVHRCIAASTAAQTARNRGELLASKKPFMECAADECPAIVRSRCTTWLAEVQARVPSVVIRVTGPHGEDVTDATLSLDGAPAKLDGLPVVLDPGEHSLSVVGASGEKVDEKLLLREGERLRQVTVALPVHAVEPPRRPEPEESTAPVPVGAWVVGGAGIAILGAAAYFLAEAGHDLAQLNSTCSPHCSSSQASPGKTDALLGDVSLGVGGGAVAGAVLWALLPRHTVRADVPVSLQLLPTPTGVRGGLTIAF